MPFEDIFAGLCLRLAPFNRREVAQRSALQEDDNILIPNALFNFILQGVGGMVVINLHGNVLQLLGIPLARQEMPHCINIPMLCPKSVLKWKTKLHSNSMIICLSILPVSLGYCNN